MNGSPSFLEQLTAAITHDPRPAKNGWAPGLYKNKCVCGPEYLGSKHSSQCADCAYAQHAIEKSEPVEEDYMTPESREQFRADVKKLALDNGFKLKDQGDGVMDLNPYVYSFAEALAHKVIEETVNGMEEVNDSTYT